MSLPQSWTDNPRMLGDWINPVGNLPNNKPIHMHMVKDGQSERWSRDTTSAAVMRFAVNHEAITDPIRRRILHDSLLGGFSRFDQKKHTPMPHPYNIGLGASNQGLYCKDVLSIVPQGSIPRTDDVKEPINYSIDIMTLNFETSTYPVNETTSPSDQWNPNFINVEYRPASSRVQSPLGWYVFSTGAYAGYASLLGAFKTMPTCTLSLTVHQVKKRWLFPNGGHSLYSSIINPNFGFVNAQAFGDWAAEKLLLDSAEYRPYTNLVGEHLCDVRLNFMASDWGFNRSADPGNSIESVRQGSVSGPKPFLTFGVDTMLTAIHPK